MSLDKQSHKGRMRWLSAAPTADPSTANDPLAPTVHKLLPSTFVFVLPRPLPNAQLSVSLYVTNSARCVQYMYFAKLITKGATVLVLQYT